ncbi:oxidoreductase FixC [Salmonella enterica subsp. enterica serovar Heidelberg]|nr:oxidoreductase FixC [Salmonella enterica subsp. enterica serovar Heidelberg]
MSDDKFDAIVVGAGVAGTVAAYVMAKAGLDVLVIERGNSAGSKNMTGGRLYAHSIESIMPGFATSAPIERVVTREKISFLTEESAVTLDFHRAPPTPPLTSYTVLRNKLDPWLMAQAEQAGAQFIPGVRVDALVREGNRVTGVQAGDDILDANIVILADGVNSMLGRSLDMVPVSSAHHYAVGVKELIGLSPALIEERFNLAPHEGAAWLFAGAPSNGLMGGGFLYTNRDSVSLGLVCGLGDIAHATKSVPQMLEDFKQHPAIRPLIQGGTLLEYSAHMVPEGGIAMMPELANDGVMIVGDAAGLCLNLGYTVRGMDLAIASAQAAAQTAIDAKARQDFSAASLAGYKRALEKNGVLRDMRHFRKLPGLMENPRLFTEYPRMAANIVGDLFTVDGGPVPPLRKTILSHAKKIGTGESIKRRHKRGYGIMSSDNKVNVDVKLGVNKFYVDEGHPHIILRSSPDMQEFNKLIKACPAGLYKLDDAGNIHFDSAGCLECGTCRVLCGNTLLEKWEYPAGTFGVEFRYG